MEDAELRRYHRAARQQVVTLSEWTRQALRRARTALAEGDTDAKLRAIRAAASLREAPAPDIEQMLAETERGYLGDLGPGNDA